jgi:hypothetical protein
MNDAIRDAAVRERLAQSLADYYYRRTLGIVCFDPRLPNERAEYDELYRRKFALARHTLNKILESRQNEDRVLAPRRRRTSLIRRLRGPGRGQTLASSTSSIATGLPL